MCIFPVRDSFAQTKKTEKMDTPMPGAEILIQSLLNHHVNTVFGFPGSCVMTVLDCLYGRKDSINHILVRHEQGAVHAAQGYAQVSKKVGVALLTSGPGATNAVTGIADAMANSIPLVVITGQVHSSLLGTDAFQEVDIIGITHSMTKWVYQIRSANEIASAIAHAFYIASSGRPGPVLLDITKDAQTEKAIYVPQKVDFIRSYNPKVWVKEPETINSPNKVKGNAADLLIDALVNIDKELILVLDVEHNFIEESGKIEIVQSAKFGTMGFGLPAAIGAKYAAPHKTVCLLVSNDQFQATIQELGVIMQSGIDIKIILLNDDTNKIHSNPDFTQVLKAYNIGSGKVSDSLDIVIDNIQKMLDGKRAYLLDVKIENSHSKRPNVLA